MNNHGNVKDMPEADNGTNRPLESTGESIPGIGDDHPLNDVIGTHEGPVWESILKNIRRNRKRADREYANETE